MSVDISSMISLIKNRNNKGYSGSPCLTPSKLSNASESTPPALTRSRTDEYLVSVLSKLFTSILTERLLSWFEDEDKLIDNQFGFRPGRSTVDAIFITLTSTIGL
jgi:hypothetical protein